MKMDKNWCIRMAELEGDSEVGAGLLALDPSLEEYMEESDSDVSELHIAFGRFVRLLRRDAQLTLEELAEKTSVDIGELVGIENDARHTPEARTIYQLSEFFGLPRQKLMQLSGLTVPKDQTLVNEAMRFAARSEPVSVLSREERSVLDTFVSVLASNAK